MLDTIIEDALATLQKNGYRAKAEYTLSADGEIVEIRFVILGRC